MKHALWTTLGLSLLSLHAGLVPPSDAQTRATTPAELVAAYDSLADTLLGAMKTERKLVVAILTTTYAKAKTALDQAKIKIQAGEDTRAEIEGLAALAAQLGNEGDASVAAIRKRLVEGGHHHHAGGEQQGIYEEGFVVVTRAAKKTFLASATEIGKLAGSPNLGALETEWRKVQAQFTELMESEKR